MDGQFVNNKTLSIDQIVDKLPRGLNYEFHWMVKNPAQHIEHVKGNYLHLVHAEAINDFDSLIKTIRLNGGKLGIAINPSTNIETISNYMSYTHRILVMSVNPGFSYQAYIPEVELKVKELSKIERLDVEMDGGINEQTIRRGFLAGARKFAAASAVFGKENVKVAIENLYKSAEGLM